MSQVVGVFGLLDFTMLWSILASQAFKTYELFISLIFKIVLGGGTVRITETTDTESTNIGARLYIND
jgi:hypothetical protein